MGKNKRELILEAALDMFVNNGFESSPTSKIAKQAGVATGTLFHYFKTKDELINELYLEAKMELVSALKQNLYDANTIRQKLECIWYNYVKWSLNSPAAMKFLSMFGTSSYISKSTREEGYKQFTFVIETLKQGVQEEVIKNFSMKLLSEVTFGILNGTINYFRDRETDFQDKNIRDIAFSIFWDALKR